MENFSGDGEFQWKILKNFLKALKTCENITFFVSVLWWRRHRKNYDDENYKYTEVKLNFRLFRKMKKHTNMVAKLYANQLVYMWVERRSTMTTTIININNKYIKKSLQLYSQSYRVWYFCHFQGGIFFSFNFSIARRIRWLNFWLMSEVMAYYSAFSSSIFFM